MSKKYNASICVTDLIKAVQARHSGIYASEKNKKIYATVDIWINDQENQFGQIGSVKVRAKKDSKDEDFYIANLREFKPKDQAAPSSEKDTFDPFAQFDKF
jgi:hypothetical protein